MPCFPGSLLGKGYELSADGLSPLPTHGTVVSPLGAPAFQDLSVMQERVMSGEIKYRTLAFDRPRDKSRLFVVGTETVILTNISRH